MRCLASICLTFLLATIVGCPRTSAPGTQRLGGEAEYPWQLPGAETAWQDELPRKAQPTPESAEAGDGAQLDLPERRGPALQEKDTLIEANLPGKWQQVCVCFDERIDIPPFEDLDLLELRADGSMIWQARSSQQETQYLEGNWKKTAAGQLTLQVKDFQSIVLYSQMPNANFLYFWNYDQKVGHWFVRTPPTGSNRILRNRFRSTFGNMIWTEVGDRGFRGVVLGEYERTVGGLYLPGIVTMRWEEQATNTGGYAAFIVDPQFKTLDGVWWIDDYEAAPFGGQWSGEADDTIEMPAVQNSPPAKATQPGKPSS